MYAAPIERDDEQLVARAQRGDAGAVNQLLSRHYDRLYAVCRRVAGNDADAADGCQEALLAIVRGLPKFDGRSSFKTWSYRVATNACLDEIRRRNRRPIVVEDTPEPVTDNPSPDQQLVDRMAIDEAMGLLTEEFRLPVILRDVSGMDYAEIAKTIGIPPGTVRSRIARGRKQLSEILGNQTGPDQRHNE